MQKYENKRRITVFLLSGSFSSSTQQLTSRLVRALQSPSPSDIAMCQKRNNSLCGMMVHAKYENERRITVFLLSGSFSSSRHPLTSRLVRALQSPSPSEIVKSQKRNNSLCGMMVQANYKIMKEKRTILLSGRDSSL